MDRGLARLASSVIDPISNDEDYTWCNPLPVCTLVCKDFTLPMVVREIGRDSGSRAFEALAQLYMATEIIHVKALYLDKAFFFTTKDLGFPDTVLANKHVVVTFDIKEEKHV